MDNDNITDFAKAKFSRNLNPVENAPITALREAIDWLEGACAEGLAVDHVIILMGRSTKDGGSGTKYFQAGKYPHHAQMGLCSEGALMIRDSG
jgi:hypothetical protein